MTGLAVDTVVLGGGAAGLWTLRELLDAGVNACLVERAALGCAQSMQAQGIIHGGGKYALRRVGDVAAIKEIRAMPERWRAHHAGERSPSLRSAHTTSEHCWLWLPRRSLRARLESFTLLPMLRHGGVLAAPPTVRPRTEWPRSLQEHALSAYRMDEPVFDTVSVVKALAAPVGDRLLQGEVVGMEQEIGGWHLRFADAREIRTRCVVACAGSGNAELLELAGSSADRMQRRPLRMGLLRGDLPALHGHCVMGGRTRVSITSVADDAGRTVWQVGGEIAERWAARTTDDGFFADLAREIGTVLPGLSLSGIEVADYAAVRAEAAHQQARRPSGVQVEEALPGLTVAWPTKLALAPVLASDIAERIVPGRSRTDALFSPGDWPRASLGRPPWEQATWRSAHSATPA